NRSADAAAHRGHHRTGQHDPLRNAVQALLSRAAGHAQAQEKPIVKPAPRQLVTTAFRAMNTQIEMQLAIDTAAPRLAKRVAAAQADLEAAAARLRHLEATLTRFQPTSELSALNRASGA